MARHRDAAGLGRDAQNRARIAGLAARLIAEHGLADWSLAKRKAAPTDYVLLDELNTRPRTSYAALIRNLNPAIKSGQS